MYSFLFIVGVVSALFLMVAGMAAMASDQKEPLQIIIGAGLAFTCMYSLNSINEIKMERYAIKNGVGYYDSSTGEFQWKDPAVQSSFNKKLLTGEPNE